MKTYDTRRFGRRAFTRREWLVGSGVVLALLGLTALEMRKSRVPVCGPGCSTCGSDLAAITDAWLANPSNRPPAFQPAPEPAATNRANSTPR
jgi:hypothetical protein